MKNIFIYAESLRDISEFDNIQNYKIKFTSESVKSTVTKMFKIIRRLEPCSATPPAGSSCSKEETKQLWMLLLNA